MHHPFPNSKSLVLILRTISSNCDSLQASIPARSVKSTIWYLRDLCICGDHSIADVTVAGGRDVLMYSDGFENGKKNGERKWEMGMGTGNRNGQCLCDDYRTGQAKIDSTSTGQDKRRWTSDADCRRKWRKRRKWRNGNNGEEVN